MILNRLILKNIGPFENSMVDFTRSEDDTTMVTLLTGDNGSGKSIVIDAIRAILMTGYGVIERDIVANSDFSIALALKLPLKDGIANVLLETHKKESDRGFVIERNTYNIGNHMAYSDNNPYNWLIEYWPAKNTSISQNGSGIQLPNFKGYMNQVLQGTSQLDVYQTIGYFDMLSNSKNEDERSVGLIIHDALKRVISIAVKDGEYDYFSVTTFIPMIKVQGKSLSLAQLSSGNQYIINKLVSLLFKALSVQTINRNTEFAVKNILGVPGVILIDEIENHLHPKWQKVILSSIVQLFPNLQIIATTHSPFVVASVERANIYVCNMVEGKSVVSDETDIYSSMPIDEILTTELFDTLPFNKEITNLMELRDKYISEGDKAARKRVEDQLVEINPQYFDFLTLGKD